MTLEVPDIFNSTLALLMWNFVSVIGLSVDVQASIHPRPMEFYCTQADAVAF